MVPSQSNFSVINSFFSTGPRESLLTVMVLKLGSLLSGSTQLPSLLSQVCMRLPLVCGFLTRLITMPETTLVSVQLSTLLTDSKSVVIQTAKKQTGETSTTMVHLPT
eukprot:CAMPEP_0176359652 /NCGR_PEP_ID=MMETSP0126-20121128/16546_1 /TAXON_ID=141414 ORGANISM="Strombidinopsis acuminatum, Strain SPMC142" /NCGR_SAMPLE_ID=MMETSP0126 /ASSEMBLY_ACC=CAM_ASM_000229 /LENGTH=106 /DNA_ID=CAMNT_0017714591 /DNA_START=923 /DNA_END=1243 /DNA_ORIENTATION=-